MQYQLARSALARFRYWSRFGKSLPLWLAALIGLSGCSDSATAPPPLEIPYVVVEARDVTIPVDVVGETIGSIDVSIRARVDGFIDGLHFQEGAFVDEGQLLYTIDTQPFQAKLAQAKAAYAQSLTGLAKTKADLDRIRPLAEMKAVSEQDLDSAVANFEAAQSFQDAAAAEVELAELELSYARIHSPVNGLIGLSDVETGDYISQQNNGGLLNVVSTTDPIGVRVAIPERSYLRFAREEVQANRSRQQRAEDEPSSPLTLILADGTIYEHTGRATKVDRNIDSMTGSLTLEANFANPDDLLRPGMFARIRFDVDSIEGALLVPQRAVNELQSAYRIFVILPDDTIEVRQVEVGQQLGSEWIIDSGLKVGERVAVSGLLRLRPGMTVAPIPAEPDDLPPKPDSGA